MKTIRILPVILPLLALAACGDADAAGGGATLRDSAGIRIVENRDGRWRRDSGWKLSDEPTLQIGVAEGDAKYQMDRVRSALRLRDGRIVVANSGSQEIRWYDAGGRHVASTGRKGGGPGEFQGLQALRRLPGDSLLAYDLLAARLSWFDPAGRFVRSESLQSGGGIPMRFVDRFDDGALLLSTSVRTFASGPPSGTTRDTMVWIRSAGGTLDSLPVTPGAESAISIISSGGAIESMNVLSLPFMRNVQSAAAGDRYWQGVTERYELVLRSADGTPERIVRRLVDPVPVRGAYLDSLRRVQATEHGPEAAKSLDQVALPDALPVFERLLVDDAGNLWVQRMSWPGDAQPEWDVFDGEGRMLGTVRMPAGFRAMHIGADFVLGVWKNEDDVEFVRMYALKK
jgi:hypothetical protein